MPPRRTKAAVSSSPSGGRELGLTAWPSLRFDDPALDREFTSKQFRACVPACITLSALHVFSHVVTLMVNPPEMSWAHLVAQTLTGVFALLSHAYSHRIEDDQAAHATFVLLNELNVVWITSFAIWFLHQKKLKGESIITSLPLYDSWLVGIEGFVFFAVTFAMHLLVFPRASRIRIILCIMIATITPWFFSVPSWTALGQPRETLFFAAVLFAGDLVGRTASRALRQMFLTEVKRREKERAELVALLESSGTMEQVKREQLLVEEKAQLERRLADATDHATALEQARREQLVASKQRDAASASSGARRRRTSRGGGGASGGSGTSAAHGAPGTGLSALAEADVPDDASQAGSGTSSDERRRQIEQEQGSN